MPLAHTEAPTYGSVILAALVLKLAVYGYLRFILPGLSGAHAYYSPVLYTLAGISTVLASLLTIRQLDLKKLVAYSSIAHMALALSGLAIASWSSLIGAILLSITHALSSTILFSLVGSLYQRTHSRLLRYFRGLHQVAPIWTSYYLLGCLINMAIPGSGSFVAELLVLCASLSATLEYGLILSTSVIWSGTYGIWSYTRLSHGSIALYHQLRHSDLGRLEAVLLVPPVGVTVLLGV